MESPGNNSKTQTSALAYLEEQNAFFRSGGYWNCLAAAREISTALLAEGKKPWIARLRETKVVGGRSFHDSLIPHGCGIAATWTTHYVCCCDGRAYDPVAGKPIHLKTYSLEVFGKQIPTEVFVSAGELRVYLIGVRLPRVSRKRELES